MRSKLIKLLNRCCRDLICFSVVILLIPARKRQPSAFRTHGHLRIFLLKYLAGFRNLESSCLKNNKYRNGRCRPMRRPENDFFSQDVTVKED
jgi:hypothetical protein